LRLARSQDIFEYNTGSPSIASNIDIDRGGILSAFLQFVPTWTDSRCLPEAYETHLPALEEERRDTPRTAS
jgi:hypothetical protein